MKFILGLLVISMISMHGLHAQKIEYNRIILPSNAKGVPIEEKLVQLAWENFPENRILINNTAIAKTRANLTKVEWLNYFAASGNLNEFNIDPSTDIDNRAQFYPKYNIGVRIPIGNLITNPMETRIAKFNHLNEQEKLNQQKLKIRSLVLSRYYEYQRHKELLTLYTQSMESALAKFNYTEKQFINGEINIETYNEALNFYNIQMANKLNAEMDFKLARVGLEEIIGVNLDDIILNEF